MKKPTAQKPKTRGFKFSDSEPVAPEPVAPEPVAPEPVAPEPVAPEPVAPEPVAPEPLAPEPVAPEPKYRLDGGIDGDDWEIHDEPVAPIKTDLFGNKETQKQETRGRHKKDCDCSTCKAKKAQEANGGSKGTTKGKTSPENSNKPYDASLTNNEPIEVDLSDYISGAMLLMLMDAVMPSLVIKLMSFKDARYKNVPKSLLQLTSEEAKTLQPLADQVVKIVIGRVDPVTAFFAMYTILTGVKLSMIDLYSFENKKRRD